MEQGLYSQVILLRREDLKFVATDHIKNEAKFKFQDQPARSQRWFDLDFDWIEVNFSTREPDFYKKLFQRHDDTKDIDTFKLFKFKLEMKNAWNHLNFKMMPQSSSIVKSH